VCEPSCVECFLVQDFLLVLLVRMLDLRLLVAAVALLAGPLVAVLALAVERVLVKSWYALSSASV